MIVLQPVEVTKNRDTGLWVAQCFLCGWWESESTLWKITLDMGNDHYAQYHVYDFEVKFVK